MKVRVVKFEHRYKYLNMPHHAPEKFYEEIIDSFGQRWNQNGTPKRDKNRDSHINY